MNKNSKISSQRFKELQLLLIEKLNIKKFDNLIYFYKDGKYESNVDFFKHEINVLLNEIDTELLVNDNLCLEFYNSFCKSVKKGEDLNSTPFIPFANLLYDVKAKNVIDYSPEFNIRKKLHLNYEYKPIVANAIIDNYFKEVFYSENDFENFQMFLAYCLYEKTTINKLFVFKNHNSIINSILNYILIEIFGDNNISQYVLGKDKDFERSDFCEKILNLRNNPLNFFTKNNISQNLKLDCKTALFLNYENCKSFEEVNELLKDNFCIFNINETINCNKEIMIYFKENSILLNQYLANLIIKGYEKLLDNGFVKSTDIKTNELPTQKTPTFSFNSEFNNSALNNSDFNNPKDIKKEIKFVEGIDNSDKPTIVSEKYNTYSAYNMYLPQATYPMPMPMAYSPQAPYPLDMNPYMQQNSNFVQPSQLNNIPTQFVNYISEPIEVVEPINQVEPIEVVEPINQVEPIEVVEPINQVEPIEVVEPINQVEPIEVVEPINQVEPIEAVEPIEVVEPIDQVEPIEVIGIIKNEDIGINSELSEVINKSDFAMYDNILSTITTAEDTLEQEVVKIENPIIGDINEDINEDISLIEDVLPNLIEVPYTNTTQHSIIKEHNECDTAIVEDILINKNADKNIKYNSKKRRKEKRRNKKLKEALIESATDNILNEKLDEPLIEVSIDSISPFVKNNIDNKTIILEKDVEINIPQCIENTETEDILEVESVEPKKDGFFKRLFGKKNKNNIIEDNEDKEGQSATPVCEEIIVDIPCEQVIINIDNKEENKDYNEEDINYNDLLEINEIKKIIFNADNKNSGVDTPVFETLEDKKSSLDSNVVFMAKIDIPENEVKNSFVNIDTSINIESATNSLLLIKENYEENNVVNPEPDIESELEFATEYEIDNLFNEESNINKVIDADVVLENNFLMEDDSLEEKCEKQVETVDVIEPKYDIEPIEKSGFWKGLFGKKNKVGTQPVTKNKILDDTVVEDTILDDIIVDDTVVEDTILDNMIVDDTIVKDAILDDIIVDDTIVKDTILDDIIVDDIIVDDAILDDIIVDDTVVEDTILDDTIVKDAILDDIIVDDTVVEDTILDDTIVKGTILDDIIVDNTIVKDTILDDIIVDDTVIEDTILDNMIVDDTIVKDTILDDIIVDDTVVDNIDIKTEQDKNEICDIVLNVNPDLDFDLNLETYEEIDIKKNEHVIPLEETQITRGDYMIDKDAYAETDPRTLPIQDEHVVEEVVLQEIEEEPDFTDLTEKVPFWKRKKKIETTNIGDILLKNRNLDK